MADGEGAILRVSTATDVPSRASAVSPRKLVRWVLLTLGPALLVVLGIHFYLAGGRYVSTDNAYVKADMVTISAEVPGTVAEVAVHENEAVEAGQLLFRLDDETYRIALAAAQAQLGVIRNDIESTRATYRQRLAEIGQAEADVAFFEREYNRQTALAQRSVASKAKLDQARHNLAVAREKVAALHQEAAAVLASLGGDLDSPVEKDPRYLKAKAARDEARRDLRDTRVVAPVAGVVTNVDHLQPGEYLPAAAPAFSLVATGHVWIEANPKETDLTYVEPGQPATVTVDTYPGREWHGTVAGLSPATGAEFAVLPPQNASGNWVKVVQRIPVRVRIETDDDLPPLRAGMSASVEIDTGRQRSLPALVKSAVAWTGLTR